MACPARGYTWALVYGEGSGPGMPGPYGAGADSISAREVCHCRRRPRATNGRPYTCNKAGMQFFDGLNRRTPRGIPHTSICGAAGKKKGAARRRLRKVNVQMRAETEPSLFFIVMPMGQPPAEYGCRSKAAAPTKTTALWMVCCAALAGAGCQRRCKPHIRSGTRRQTASGCKCFPKR